MDKETIRMYLENEVSFYFSRSSGPGGQNVNKVNTKVTLNWSFEDAEWLSPKIKDRIRRQLRNRINAESMLVVHSQKYRTQPRNVEDCLDKLSELLQPLTEEAKVRKPTKPSKRAKERRLQAKKERSERKQWRGKLDY